MLRVLSRCHQFHDCTLVCVVVLVMVVCLCGGGDLHSGSCICGGSGCT